MENLSYTNAKYRGRYMQRQYLVAPSPRWCAAERLNALVQSPLELPPTAVPDGVRWS